MQFLVIAYDGTDEAARDRRLAARAGHLKSFEEMYNQGTFLFGSAILNDEGKMIGSLIVADFPSRQELDERWLQHAPYVVGEVWKKIEVAPAMVPPLVLKK